MHPPTTSEPVNRSEPQQLFPISALFTTLVCWHHSWTQKRVCKGCGVPTYRNWLYQDSNIFFCRKWHSFSCLLELKLELKYVRDIFTSCLNAFLNPVMGAGAKALPGTQLTTTGNPPAQVPLDFSDVAWPSLQLDKWASLPVQFIEKSQNVGFLLRANILDRWMRTKNRE